MQAARGLFYSLVFITTLEFARSHGAYQMYRPELDNDRDTRHPPVLPLTTDCGDGSPQHLANYSGVFSTPNYPASYPPYSYCSWLMKSPEDDGAIMLDFSAFHIGSADDVHVYDGNSSDAYMLALFYGLINPPPSTVFSTQPNMFLVFRSNYNYAYPGFNALYTADTACSSHRSLNDVSGGFNSPYFPETFTRNKQCIWTLDLHSSETAYIYFNYFNVGQLFANGSCSSSAYVEIFRAGGLSDRYCGSNIPSIDPLFNSTSIYFLSDSSQPTAGQGFDAVYYTTRTTTTATTTVTSPPTITTQPTAVTTTLPPSIAPDIKPDPFVRVKLNGTCLASDVVVTLDCADAYSQEFESSLVGVASQAMTAVRQGRLCVGGAVAAVSSGSTSLVAVANTMHISFSVVVYPADYSTVRDVELCAYDVLGYVQDFSNWRVPILASVWGCPSVDFNPTRFDQMMIKWSCA